MNILNVLPKKTFLLVALLALILLTILYLLFVQRNTPPTSSPEQLPPTISTIPLPSATPQTIPTFRSLTNNTTNYDIVFSLPEGFTLPNTIENIQVERAVNDTYIQYLQERFNISGEPKTAGSAYFWSNDALQQSMTVDISSGYVQFKTSSTQSTSRINKEQAESIAEDFLTTLNVVSIAPNTARITMLAGDEEVYETQNENDATFYEASYIQSHKGVPIYYHYATPATISVLIDNNGNIRHLQYFNIQPVKTTQTTLLSLEQVKERVTNGEYTITKISGNPQTIPTTGTITITKATAIHFDDKKSPFFFPTILLEGTLQPSGREISLYFSVLTTNQPE